MTTQTATPALSDAAIRSLETRLLGRVIRPGESDYDLARQIQKADIDRRPALIVRISDAADVIRAVQFAQEHDLPLAIRSGGHSAAGHSVVDGGVVVDLSHLRALSIDRTRQTVWAQPGVTTGYLAPKAYDDGLALSTGDTASVALGGLTLGGGIGWLVRRDGLTIDHLLSAEVVTADGRLLKVSDNEHPDLFWALRGGGGNFGVVTGYEFRLQPLGMIVGGLMALPATPDIVRAYLNVAVTAPDELTTIAMIAHLPPLPFIPQESWGSLALVIFVCYAGEVSAGQHVVTSLRSLARPLFDQLGSMPYPTLFEMTQHATRRVPNEVRAMFADDLDENLIDTALQVVDTAPSHAMVQIRPLGGAMARVPVEATAFAHRDKRYFVSLVNQWENADQQADQVAWIEQAWQQFQPAARGAYTNFLADEGEQRVREAYPAATYARLAQVKRQYDPENVFRLNQNIRPAGR